MPIDQVTGWLFRVARNRISGFFRKRGEKKLYSGFRERHGRITEVGRSAFAWTRAGTRSTPRQPAVDELELAIEELPKEQREVFVAHELEGRSFKQIAVETGVSLNTLLSRKRYACCICASDWRTFTRNLRKQ